MEGGGDGPSTWSFGLFFYRFVGVSVIFQYVAKAKMDGLAVTSYTSNVPGTGFIADGDLQLQQRSTLPYVADGIYVPYLNSPLVSLDAATTLNQILPDTIISQYRERNFTTFMNVPYPLWEPDYAYVPSSASIPGSPVAPNRGLSGTGRTFTTTMKVRIPPIPVLIRPPISQELKWGWIQYLSFLVLTVIVAWILRKVIFGYHVLETSIFVDAPRSKLHVE
jgi:Transmembrane protein 231